MHSSATPSFLKLDQSLRAQATLWGETHRFGVTIQLAAIYLDGDHGFYLATVPGSSLRTCVEGEELSFFFGLSLLCEILFTWGHLETIVVSPV